MHHDHRCPGSGPEFYRIAAANIRRTGRHIVYVMSDDDHDGFAYTIGNHLVGYPELLMTLPMRPEHVTWILNEMSLIQKERGRAFEHGELVSMGEGSQYPLKMLEVGDYARSEFTIRAGRYLKTENYRVRQVLIPDESGNFPDGKCDPPYDMQVIARSPSEVTVMGLRGMGPVGRA